MEKGKIIDIGCILLLFFLSFMLLRNIIFFSGILIIGNLPVNPLRDYYRGWFSWDYFYNLGFSRREIGPDLLRNLFYLPFYKLFGLENFSKSILYLSVFLFPIIVFLGRRYKYLKPKSIWYGIPAYILEPTGTSPPSIKDSLEIFKKRSTSHI